jgi:hypothetical protein
MFKDDLKAMHKIRNLFFSEFLVEGKDEIYDLGNRVYLTI